MNEIKFEKEIEMVVEAFKSIRPGQEAINKKALEKLKTRDPKLVLSILKGKIADDDIEDAFPTLLVIKILPEMPGDVKELIKIAEDFENSSNCIKMREYIQIAYSIPKETLEKLYKRLPILLNQ